jgi:hypothetical protein
MSRELSIHDIMGVTLAEDIENEQRTEKQSREEKAQAR